MAQKETLSADETGTRQQILRCAAGMFRTQGYAAVSLRGIAKGVGMTTGSLYYHFKSKEEIVSEILEHGHRNVLIEVQKSVEALGPRPSCRRVLKAAIQAHIMCLLGEDSFPAANIRIFAHVPPEIRISGLGGRHEYERYWIGLLRRCGVQEMNGKNVNPAVLSNLLFGAMNWTVEWYKPGRHSIDDVSETLTHLLVNRAAHFDVVPARGRKSG